MHDFSAIDLNSLAIFHAVVERGSFTGAADRLGVAKAKVSVQIGRLERQLGLSLFTRTTRQVVLTDAGRTLHAQCQPLLDEIADALAQLGRAHEGLSGTLRIGTTVSHAQQSLAPALARFAQLHPALQFDVRTSDRVSDMAAEGLDLAIRFGWLRDASVRASRLGTFEQLIVAAPAYLAATGAIDVPEDLERREWLALTLLATPNTWTLADADGASRTVHVRGRMRADAPGAVLALALAGAGVAVLEDHAALPEIAAGRLVRVLPQWRLPPGGIFAVLPPGRYVAPRVRAFIDFYRDFLA